MTSTRRHFLHATGLLTAGVLAGCLGASGGGGEDSPGTPSPEPELPDDDGSDGNATRPSGTGGPAATVVSVDDAPTLPLEPGIAVVTAAATETSPPVLRASLTNTGEEPLVVGEGRAIRFQYVTDDSRTLQLLPADGDYPVAAGNCWRLEEAIATTMEYRTDKLAPGETIEADIGLYALAEYDGCLPVGEFRFETTYSILPEAESADEEQAEWGFSLVLE
jgi:hypothetical protein